MLNSCLTVCKKKISKNLKGASPVGITTGASSSRIASLQHEVAYGPTKTHLSVMLISVLQTRGRPSRNAANTFPDFSAGLSQNSVIVKKIKQLVEEHEKLTICKGNSAPFRLFLLKIVLKFKCRFLL